MSVVLNNTFMYFSLTFEIYTLLVQLSVYFLYMIHVLVINVSQNVNRYFNN
jgi:hypothetical protein